MGRSILDEIALKTRGISAALEAQRSLLEHRAVFEVQRRLDEMMEQSGIAATQRRLAATVQKLAPSLSASVEQELLLRDGLLKETALGAGQFSDVVTFRPLGQVENTAIQSLRSLTDSVAGGALL